jgi:hypothetical protein
MQNICAGCCNSGMCWVCLGNGTLEIARGLLVLCHKCDGTTHCHVCRDERDRRERGRSIRAS